MLDRKLELKVYYIYIYLCFNILLLFLERIQLVALNKWLAVRKRTLIQVVG